jgi:hypothetical protein
VVLDTGFATVAADMDDNVAMAHIIAHVCSHSGKTTVQNHLEGYLTGFAKMRG